MSSFVRASFDLANEYGKQGELWVHDLVEHLRNGAGSIEVKRKSRVDPQFYVEVEKLSYGEWVPSGLSTTEATVWFFVIGDTGCGVVLSTERLRAAIERAAADPRRVKFEAPSATQRTRGYVLHLVEVLEAA